MPTIKFHQDLRVYQKSFDTAMEIYQLSKIFPKKNVILLQIRYEGPHAQFLPILVKPGGKENMRNLIFQNLQILKVKPEKPKHGCNLQEVVSILMKNNLKF